MSPQTINYDQIDLKGSKAKGRGTVCSLCLRKFGEIGEICLIGLDAQELVTARVLALCTYLFLHSLINTYTLGIFFLLRMHTFPFLFYLTEWNRTFPQLITVPCITVLTPAVNSSFVLSCHLTVIYGQIRPILPTVGGRCGTKAILTKFLSGCHHRCKCH